MSYKYLGCRALDGIKLPESLISMGERTFMECTSLSSIAIPATLTSIPQSAFFDCQSLKYVSLPATVTTIGDGAFSQCGLESIDIPSRVDSIGKSAFNGCAQLKSIALPDELTCIDIATFENCPQLQSIVLPENLKEIKQQAFSNDNNIKVVTAKMRQPMPFKETGINITQPATLYIPEGTREAYAEANWLGVFDTVREISITDITQLLSIHNSKPSSLTPWYTLSGRRITTTPTRPGLCIKDGRKVLIK